MINSNKLELNTVNTHEHSVQEPQLARGRLKLAICKEQPRNWTQGKWKQSQCVAWLKAWIVVTLTISHMKLVQILDWSCKLYDCQGLLGWTS